MENNKLIPLSDYVLEQERILEEIYANFTDPQEPNNARLEFVVRVTNYTRFLEQPLILEMLIGENKLFEGFEIKDIGWYKSETEVCNKNIGIEIELHSGGISLINPNGIGYGIVKVVEDLAEYGLTLTPSALQQIGIKE